MSVESTYAEALYEAAAADDALARVSSELAEFRGALRDSPELTAVLENPEVSVTAKKSVVGELVADAHPLVSNFLLVLLDRTRLEELESIGEAFSTRVAEAEGRIEVFAVTAVPLADDLRERIVSRVAEQTGREVELTQAVDPDVIGGLVLHVGNTVVDGSIVRRLSDLRNDLVTAPVEAAATAE